MSSAAPTKVSFSSLRPLWLALPFMPWAASLAPWFAPFISLGWLALVLYFWPVHWIAHALGFNLREGPGLEAIHFAYCIALALAAEGAMRLAGRRRGVWRQIPRAAPRLAVGCTAALILFLFGFRYAQWIDWPARPAPADHPLAALRDHQAQFSDLYVYEVKGHYFESDYGFLDSLYVARLRARPRLLPELIESLELEPYRTGVPEWFWTAPAAHWWKPPRSGDFYKTRDFSLETRGPDGEHYLILHRPEDELFWVWAKSNF